MDVLLLETRQASPTDDPTPRVTDDPTPRVTDDPAPRVTDGSRSRLAEQLRAAGCSVRAHVADASALEAAFREHAADIIVVAAARPDPELVAQLGALGQRCDRPVAMFVEQTDAESIRAAVRAGISSHVVRGDPTDRPHHALELAHACFLEQRALRTALDSAKTSLAERKLIERAKGHLMKHGGLDEPAAYAALRTRAMRRNARLVDVARAVLAGADA